MTKILIVIDVYNWAYHTKALQLKQWAEKPEHPDFLIDIVSVKDKPYLIEEKAEKADLFLFMGYQNYEGFANIYPEIMPENTLVSIASHSSWDNGRTFPKNQVKPDKELINYLSQFRGVSAVSYRLQLLFRSAGLKNIVYTPNGVPTDLFTPGSGLAREDGIVVCGYVGRENNQKKGNISILGEVERLASNVEFKNISVSDSELEDPNSEESNFVSYEDMPEFYKGLDIILISSREEGSSRVMLEAMACGCVVLTTDCGASNELVIDGFNGFILDRDVHQFVDAIEYLSVNKKLIKIMKRRSRGMVTSYSWKNCWQYWYRWLAACLNPRSLES